MTDEILFQHGNIMVRRLRLAVDEAMPWHRDPFHRVAVVVGVTDCRLNTVTEESLSLSRSRLDKSIGRNQASAFTAP